MTLPISPLSRRGLLLPALAGIGCAALSALPAQAHGQAAGDAAAGLLHPLLGPDHLLLWLGLGALGSKAGHRWLLWGGAGGALGGVLGSLGVTLPLAEPLAGLAVAVLGLLLLLLISRGGTVAALPLGGLVAGSCAIHGLLHGAEGSGGAGWWLGLLLGSVVLVATGRVAFPLLARHWQPRLALGLAAAGLVLTGLALN